MTNWLKDRYFRNFGKLLGKGYNPAGHMQKIAILYDASQAVLSTFDLDEVLQRILLIARDYFHLQNVAILLLDKDKKHLCTRSQIGGERDFDDFQIPIGTGLIGTAARDKRPLYVPDFSKDTSLSASGKEDLFGVGDSADGPR